jgi:hypothetical protein
MCSFGDNVWTIPPRTASSVALSYKVFRRRWNFTAVIPDDRKSRMLAAAR